MKTIIFSILTLIVAPCNKSKEISAAQGPDIKTLEIIYTRTPCFGTCPVYTMTIKGETKTITYEGKAHTDKMGKYSKSISEKELVDLIEAFDKLKFNELEEQYLGHISDFPGKHILLNYKGKTKRVQDRSGGPDNLHQLEKILEDYAVSDGWTKMSAEGDQ